MSDQLAGLACTDFAHRSLHADFERPRREAAPRDATILVLGGSGFIGGAVMRAAHDAGLAAFGTTRDAGRRHPAIPNPLRVCDAVNTLRVCDVVNTLRVCDAVNTLRVCDATNPDAVTQAARNADYAVNAVLGSAETMLRATENLCDAALRLGLRRIVHISSMSVYGDASGTIDETAPLAGSGDRYGNAKIACEAVVRRFVAKGGEAVILRPGIVYGPGGEQWTGRIGRMLMARRIGDLGVLGDGFCNLAYVDDVAACVLAALSAPHAAGTSINVAGAVPITWNEYFMAFGRGLGAVPVRRVTHRRLTVETRLLAPPLQVARLAAQRLGPARPRSRLGVPRGPWLPEPLSPALLATWQRRFVLAHARADAILGVQRTPYHAGIAAACVWLQHGRSAPNRQAQPGLAATDGVAEPAPGTVPSPKLLVHAG